MRMLDRLLILVAKQARYIPEWLIRSVFACAADISWFLRIGGVSQLEKNLMRVLRFQAEHTSDSEEISRAHLRKVSKQAMRSYFAYFAEAMSVHARSEEQLLARIRGDGDGFESLSHFTRVQGGSAPLALGHQGNWDYAGFWAHHAIAPVTTVAEKLQNEELLHTFVSLRERLGMTILLTGQGGLIAQLENALRTPETIVPLLADRDLSRHGEFVSAFGSTIRVARGPATLAFDTHLPLYVVALHRERLQGARRKTAGVAYGYVCDIRGPVDVEQYYAFPREQAIHSISQAWVDVWQHTVGEHPEDWHMLQPIFLEDLDEKRLQR